MADESAPPTPAPAPDGPAQRASAAVPLPAAAPGEGPAAASPFATGTPFERRPDAPADRRRSGSEERRSGGGSERGSDDRSRDGSHRHRRRSSSHREHRSRDSEGRRRSDRHHGERSTAAVAGSAEPATPPRAGWSADWGATLLENRHRSRRRSSASAPSRRRVRTGLGALLARLLACATTFGCLMVGAWLASSHPVSSLVAVASFVALAVFGAALPMWAPVVVLPLLPVAGLMPWTGWLVAEEFDIVWLALAGGAYLRLAMAKPGDGLVPGAAPRQSLTRVAWVAAPFAASVAVSLVGGFIDAGAMAQALSDGTAGAAGAAASPVAAEPIRWHWWHGYHEALNSLRLAKPALAVALWLPLWRAASRAEPSATARRLELGMVGMGAVTALAVVAERAAHTGLLNFSTDYRATGPFWEMHVGGAALDVVLAATLPFMVALWWRSRSRLGWVLSAGVVALGLYAALVTFSRIVYLAVPLALLVAWWVRRQGRATAMAVPAAGAEASSPQRAFLVGLGVALVFTALAFWFFPGAGWRGLLGLLGALVLLLPMARQIRGWVWERWAMAGMLAVPALLLVAAMAALLPKGAYLAYAACFAACALAIVLAERGAWWAQVAAPAMYVALLVALGVVAGVWGGTRGVERALVVVVVLGGVVALAARQPLWPTARRWQGTLVLACVGIAGVVGSFGGGAYMAGRLADSGRDSTTRGDHWQAAINLLQHPEDWLFGKGLGRFPEQQALMAENPQRAGDLRLVQRPDGTSAAQLLAGTQPVGTNALFRLSQRIGQPAPGPMTLRLDVHGARSVELRAEVCEKHLLYNGRCVVGAAQFVPGDPDTPVEAVAEGASRWQPVEIQLKGSTLDAGWPWAPRWLAFSLSVGTTAGRIEIDRLSLHDASGREMLVNGQFDQGLARWYFTSDRLHLPWHAKNLLLHVLFEQGVFGVAALALLAATALWRVTGGAARRRTLAAPLAGAWVGVMTVGLVDSVLDMPRAAFVVLTLLALAVALPAGRQGSPRPAGGADEDDGDADAEAELDTQPLPPPEPSTAAPSSGLPAPPRIPG
jgi:hypothetical protein